MKKLIILFSIFIFYSSLFAVIEETDSFRGFLFGSAPNCEYDNWLSHVAEGIASQGYNAYAPFDHQTNGFGDYKIPSSADSLAWNNAVELFLAGELDLAQNIINQANLPYEVVIFHDTDFNRTYYMLREIPDFTIVDNNQTPNYPDDDEIGAFTYGWGLYVYYPDGPYPHITTAPHPNDDFPSVPMAYEVFVLQQSKFLCISGAGREVKWTEIGNYTNSKSLCDPSRVEAHPFNTAYKKFCNLIRDEFGKREFSIQIHSYDWGNSHPGRPNVQISGGNQVINPDLPIRDNSSLKLDLVNATNFTVHHANDIGIHPPVYINDFYGIHCEVFPFIYSNGDTTFAVNTNIDLPGYSSNRQMQYTQAGYNPYDNIEPFFHIEMDEFPNVYPQTTENYHWFYSWNPHTNHYDYQHLFDKFIKYYIPWVNALTEVLPYMYQMNDNLNPVAPTNLRAQGANAQNVTIAWDKGDSYDINSYEILFSNEPIENGNYQIIDRAVDYHLASLGTTSRIFYGLQPNTHYFFKIRIKDKNGNFSDMSNQLEVLTGSANITNFTARGDSSYIELNWNASYQNNCNGFNIYRKTQNSEYELLSSWQTNNDLAGNPEGAIYTFYDTTCTKNIIYTYKLSFQDTNMYEAFYQTERSAVCRFVGKIVFTQTSIFTFKDTCYFGYNEMASDGYDTMYDNYQTYSTQGDYFFCQMYEPNWNSHKTMEKEIKGYYNSQNEVKRWIIRFKTNQLNQPVTIKLANFQQRNSERIFMVSGENITNLGEGEELTFTPTTSGYYQFELFYGNFIPEITFLPPTYSLYYPNDQIDIEWISNYHQMIDHFNLFAKNSHFTIPIVQNLPNNSNSYSWNAPIIEADSLQFKIELVTTQMDTVVYISPFKIGIIYPQIDITTTQGWNLISKNFYSPNEDVGEIYGETAEFYYLDQDSFQNISEPIFTQPYWIYSQENHYYASNNPSFLHSGIEYNLNNGWNIIPNPYKIDFELSQLLFNYNNFTYEYYQAVAMDLIEPFVFDFNKEFIPTDLLIGGKSYYLYSKVENMSIYYIPYYQSQPVDYLQSDWSVKIKSELPQNDYTSSVSLIGIQNLRINSYNNLLDILKPTLKPFTQAPTLVLKNDFGGGERDYYQLAENYEPALETVENIYQAQIIVPQPTDITFKAEDFNLPPDYKIYLYFNNDYRELTPDSPVIFHSDSLITDFEIYLTNFEHLSSENDMVQLNNKVYNYPNPFNPKTVIHFLNDKPNIRTSLKIYNLKGQLVKTLIDKKIKSGEYKIIWNGTDNYGHKVASGVYLYKLQRKNEKTVIKKMLMLK